MEVGANPNADERDRRAVVIDRSFMVAINYLELWVGLVWFGLVWFGYWLSELIILYSIEQEDTGYRLQVTVSIVSVVSIQVHMIQSKKQQLLPAQGG